MLHDSCSDREAGCAADGVDPACCWLAGCAAAIDPDSRRYVPAPCELPAAPLLLQLQPRLLYIKSSNTHKDATQLVQHPVGWGIEPLHVLLWPAHLRKTTIVDVT